MPSRSAFLRAMCCFLTLATAQLLVPHPSGAVEPAREFMRGMVISCPRGGQIWGSEYMAASLDEVRKLGVGWVSIHPYATVKTDGSVNSWRTSQPEFLARAVEMTHSRGLQMFWKPHLAYWGSFNWRGDIEFGTDEEAWARFFDQYEHFIVEQARFAEASGIDLLAVGVELDATLDRVAEWMTIIKAVRSVYSGRLTYAANWDQVAIVPFWEELDLIGVHAYYPLSDSVAPSSRVLTEAWETHLQELALVSAEHDDKPVVFAEIGYNRSRNAARTPWTNEIHDNQAVLHLRSKLIETALRQVPTAPFIEGMFWWKWIPGDERHDRDFSMKDPEARELLQQHWGK